jgi:predicted deacylase
MAAEKMSDIKIERGRKTFDFLNICMMADGAPLGIPIHIVAGAKPGPKLVILSSQHGYEIWQISVIRELVEKIDPSKLKGTLVAIPVANPPAFEAGARCGWIDGVFGDHSNMNRLWPSRRDGWLTERIIYKLATEVIPGSACVMDLHAASMLALALSYGYLGQASKEDLEISKVFGQEILLDTQPEERIAKRQLGTISEYLKGQGIPCYGCEIGEFPGLWCDRGKRPKEELIRTVPEVGVTGVTNVMKHLDMMEGEPKLPARQLIAQPELVLRPSHGGLLISEKGFDDLGTVVPKGELLGTVISPYTFKELDRLTAPFNETLLLATVLIRPFLKVYPGDYAFIVADMSKSKWINNS